MSYSITEAFEGTIVRISGSPDAPLFCAADVCAVLGYSKYRDTIALLDEDERVSSKVDTPGGSQEMTHVTESGLYHLIFKSRKAASKRFRRWVTEEVLPTIRKNGKFHSGDAAMDRDLQRMTIPEWLRSLGLDMRHDARRCSDVLGYVNRAATSLRFFPGAKGLNKDSLFQEVPMPVLDLAEGLYIQGTDAWRISRVTVALPEPAAVEAEEAN